MKLQEELMLKASIQYGIAGKRFSKLRERFWDRFVKHMNAGAWDIAEDCIESFSLMRMRKTK